jgi:predicted TIM-barrel fold metal-dependent hydrolase
MKQAYRLFDCDLHYCFPSTAAMAEYLPEGASVPSTPGGRGIPHPDGAYRRDAVTPTGGVPGSDPAFAIDDHMDRHGIEYAILSYDSVLSLSAMHDLDRAAAIATAINDWTIEEWLPADQRFLGSVTVATSDPAQAAAEIRRVGSHPRMVQVYATGLTSCLMGNQLLHPIYEACSELGLPFTLHPGGGRASAPLAAPTSFVEMHTDMSFAVLPHVVSMVTEGVFVKYPNLTLVLNEYGVAWLPFLMWRLDMEYRAGRDELPWLTRLPSEYIADHVRLTTQPLEEPGSPQKLASLLSLFDAGRMLMFSSDYPHWDADNPDVVLRAFPESLRERVFFENAYETFGIAQRSARPAVAAAR